MPRTVEIRPIRTNADYERALMQLAQVWDAEADSAEEDVLDVLATLIDAYEEKHFPIDTPDPIEAILFRMEQQGLERKDLEPLIGPRGRVSEVLDHTRPLSITMIRNLHTALKIPAEVLIREPVKSAMHGVSKKRVAKRIAATRARSAASKKPATPRTTANR